jgi:hypothetical protein
LNKISHGHKVAFSHKLLKELKRATLNMSPLQQAPQQQVDPFSHFLLSLSYSKPLWPQNQSRLYLIWFLRMRKEKRKRR